MNLLKRAGAVLMVCIMIVTLFPASAFAALNLNRSARYDDGGILRDANGRTYQYSQQFHIQVYQYRNDGTHQKIVLNNENQTPRHSMVIKQGGKAYRGYCIEHGVYSSDQNTMTGMTGKGQIPFYTGLSDSQQDNIKATLLYGWSSGKDIYDTKDTLFTKSKYYKKSRKYNNDDWYIATQMLVWEIQQKYRTSDMDYNKVSDSNPVHKYLTYSSGKPVSIYHYKQPLKGHGAEDIYMYMASCVKNHEKIAKPFRAKRRADAQTIELVQETDSAGNPTNIWSATVKDDGKYPMSKSKLESTFRTLDVTKGKGKNKIDIKAVSSKGKPAYKVTWTGKNASDEPDSKEIYTVRRLMTTSKEYKEDNPLIFWKCNQGSGAFLDHAQTIVTGATDPIPFYFKLKAVSTPPPPPPTNERENPEYFPEIEIPIQKEDLNPGWDGDVHTGMGDASLGATYVLYKDGKEIDRITLDDYGSEEVFTDQPWESEDDLTMTESGSYTHVTDEGEHCTVAPTVTDWDGEVTYTVKEIRPDGRFIEPDTGQRTYKVKYNCHTENSQGCTSDPENWSENEYTIAGTPEFEEGTVTGTLEEVSDEDPLHFTLEYGTFINDCYRGKITLTKSLEDENVFDDKPTAGGKTKSTKSLWKLYLKDGYEDTKYIRFNREADLADGTAVYRATRDTSGKDNATEDMKIGSNGSLLILDVPYGEYYMEEIAADDTSFVLEKFTVVIDEHSGAYSVDERYDNRYDYDIRDKKKENKIKVVKTDAETGKTVSALAGAKFRIRYMGNQLLADPKTSKNYGKLIPNAASITDKTGYNDVFVADENGEITVPYQLKFGTYRLEEFTVPDGYFVGRYDKDGNASNADYGTRGEYGKDADGKAGNGMDWGDPALDDSVLVPIYDEKGNHVEFKEKRDVFNYYTFVVEKQEQHEDGNFGQMVDYKGNITAADSNYDGEKFPYVIYYKTVPMPNNQVKGKIEIEKKGEVLTGWEKILKNGKEVSVPVYDSWKLLAGATFGIFAEEDVLLQDGNDGPVIYDAATDELITIPTDKKTQEDSIEEVITDLMGKNHSAAIYSTGSFSHSSGAKLWYMLERAASEKNIKRTMYVSPEQKDTTYSYVYETEDDDYTYRYDIDVKLTYKAGGDNLTELNVIKTTIPKTGGLPIIGEDKTLVNELGDIVYDENGEPVYEADGETLKRENAGSPILDDEGNPVTERRGLTLPKQYLGKDKDGNWIETALQSYGGETGSRLNHAYPTYIFATDGKTEEDWNGNLTDFTTGCKQRYEVTDYTAAPVKAEEITVPDAEKPDEKVLNVQIPEGYTYSGKVEAGALIIAAKGEEYIIRVINPDNESDMLWKSCDKDGKLIPEYTIEDGWSEVPFSGTAGEDIHYVIEKKEDPAASGNFIYKVLLKDGSFISCDENGDFEAALVELYEVSYRQEAGDTRGFEFTFDGFELFSTADSDAKTAVTEITGQIKSPVIDTGIGYTYTTDKNKTTFTATEPQAPLYFKSRDGIKTEMYYFGKQLKALLTVPASAVDAGYENTVPTLKFENVDGEGGKEETVLDWFKDLSFDNPDVSFKPYSGITVNAHYNSGDKKSDVYYTIEILSDKGENAPLSITYSDGYTAKLYCATAASGNGIGVMELSSVYKTNRSPMSQLVDIITTDENGKATSKELPLGRYIVRELSAPTGYVTNDKEYRVELKYKDQNTPLVWKKIAAKNEAVSVEIDLKKVFETAYDSGIYKEEGGAVFGLYAGETISASDGIFDRLFKSVHKGDLIDVIEVGDDGKVLSSVKLPAGKYYIQEISTRGGYILNDMPFYFEVSETDSDLSSPLEFKYSGDGISGKAVMDSYGTAVVSIAVQERYPMPVLKVDGKEYLLSESSEEDGVKISKSEDAAEIKVIVKDGESRNILLPNGKSLKLAVTGNLYDYTIDGAEGHYAPKAVYTGYYGRMQREFTPEWDKIYPYTPAKATAEEAADPTLISAPAGYTAGGELKAGDNVIAAAGDKNKAYMIRVMNPDNESDMLWKPCDKDGNILPEYLPETETLIFKSAGSKQSVIEMTVTHTPKTIQRVIEPGTDLDNDGKYDKEGEKAPVTVTEGVLTAEGKQYYEHEAKFKVLDAASKDSTLSGKVSINGKEVTVDDTVEITGGDKAEVSDKYGAAFTVLLENSGKVKMSAFGYLHEAVDDETHYCSAGVYKGSELMPLDCDFAKSVTLARQDTSARTIQIKVNSFDNVNAGEIENDKDKPEIPDTPPVTPVTPEKPSIKTSARDLETGINVSKADSNVTIIDAVSYTNLVIGKEYLLKGILMDKASQKPIKDAAGREVTAEKKFIPSASLGTVDIKFVLDGSDLGNRIVVVFERLYSDNKEVAVHTDINDKEQSAYFPKLHTTAIDSKTKEHISLAAKNKAITDVVSYYNLPKGKYTVKGVLMDKGTGKTVKEAGKEIIVEKAFIVEDGKPNGTLEMDFSFDGSDFAGRTIVVFERLYRDDKEVAAHTDISDKNQSIYIPKVKTTAAYSHTGEITDIVSYSNLIRGKTYKVMGVLIDSKTEKPVKSADGKEITAVKKFVAEKEAGTVSVVFHFAEKDLAGKTVVVFETLMLEDEIIAEHKDINDKMQTVKIKKPIDGVPKTGDETGLMKYLILFIISAIGFVIAGYMMSRKKRIKN